VKRAAEWAAVAVSPDSIAARANQSITARWVPNEMAALRRVSRRRGLALSRLARELIISSLQTQQKGEAPRNITERWRRSEADQAVGDNGVSRFNEKQLTGRMSAARVLDAGRRVCGRTSG
jgi:hypothetical protein